MEKTNQKLTTIREGKERSNTKPPANGPRPPVEPAPQKPPQHQDNGQKEK